MDGENNGKAYFLMDDLGGNTPILGETPMLIFQGLVFLVMFLLFKGMVPKGQAFGKAMFHLPIIHLHHWSESYLHPKNAE